LKCLLLVKQWRKVTCTSCAECFAWAASGFW
jgi:hypothetical protein